MGLGHGSELRHVTLGIAKQTQVFFFLSCPVIWKAAVVQIPIRAVTSYPTDLTITYSRFQGEMQRA